MINRYLLKQAIAESDKTIVQIFKIAKVRRSTIYDLASGRQRTCSSDTIRRLCLTLHISADELLNIRKIQDDNLDEEDKFTTKELIELGKKENRLVIKKI